jgi:hypothetical protein
MTEEVDKPFFAPSDYLSWSLHPEEVKRLNPTSRTVGDLEEVIQQTKELEWVEPKWTGKSWLWKWGTVTRYPLGRPYSKDLKTDTLFYDDEYEEAEDGEAVLVRVCRSDLLIGWVHSSLPMVMVSKTPGQDAFCTTSYQAEKENVTLRLILSAWEWASGDNRYMNVHANSKLLYLG